MAWVLGEPTVQQYFDANGDPLVNGSIEFYTTGTSTPEPVASDSAGATTATSYTLNSIGAPQTTGGTAIALFFNTDVDYKIVRKDSSGNTINPTIDPFRAGNSTGGSAWVLFSGTPTRTSNTTFTLTGDQTSTFTVGTRLKFTDSTTLYGIVTASVYTSLTTVTVTLDSGSLSGSLSAVYHGISTTVGKEISAHTIIQNLIRTNSVNRPLINKLDEYVSALDVIETVNGSTDNTSDINSFLATAGRMYFPNAGSAYIVSDELALASNSNIIFEPGAEIKILNAGDTINGTGLGIFDFDGADNIVIHGNFLQITGVRTGTGTDNVNFALKIVGCQNVIARDILINDMAGDGVYVGEGNNSCQDVYLYNIKTTNCMRNGWSIVDGINVWVVNCQGLSTNGKNPEAGIDIETDGSAAVLKNINIVNMVCSDNKIADFALVLGGNSTPSTTDPDVKLINCTSRDSTTNVETIGFMILNHKSTYADNGNVQLTDCTAQNVNNMGLFIRNIDSASTPLYIKNMKLIDTAITAAANIKDPGTGGVIGDSPFNIENNNATFYPNPGGVYIDGLTVVDNTRDRGPYYINASAGAAWKDVEIKNLRWFNSVGTTTLPFIQTGTDAVIEKADKPFNIDRTSNLTLTTRYSGWTCTNSGAAGQVIFTLPPITSSFDETHFIFQVKSAQVLRIDPDASDKIHNFGNGDGKYVEASSIGVIMKISYYDADGWLLEINDESSLTAEV